MKIYPFSVNFDNIPFEGTYEYYPRESPSEGYPGAPAGLYIITIAVQGTSHNLVDCLDKNWLSCLESLLMEGIY